MFKFFKKISHQDDKLYNKILSLSRNKLFYTKFTLEDTFLNRIYLIFIHISFLFIKAKSKHKSFFYNKFYQKMFDLMFQKIELDMREIGYGDTVVNKNMKLLVKNFYNILLICETYHKRDFKHKCIFLKKYLTHNPNKKDTNSTELLDYFDKYQAFCFDLSPDSVLKGDLNFIYK